MSEKEARRLRTAKRIALVVATIVGLIFLGAGALGYIFFTHDRPAKEVLLGEE